MLNRPNLEHRIHRTVNILALTICAVLFTTGARQPGADLSPVPLNRFLRQVQNSYHGVLSLQADFSQIYSAGGRERRESGSVIFARGGRMRWVYREPSPKLFLSDGKNVELYLPSENQVDRSSVSQSEDYRMPFRLLLSRLDFKKYFSRIEDAPETLKHPSGNRMIVAIPKGGKDRAYDQVVIEFDPKDNIHRLAITYSDHSTMEFIFTKILRNPPLGASTFRFKPPPGTEIVEQGGESTR